MLPTLQQQGQYRDSGATNLKEAVLDNPREGVGRGILPTKFATVIGSPKELLFQNGGGGCARGHPHPSEAQNISYYR